jgi:hypothetical protein
LQWHAICLDRRSAAVDFEAVKPRLACVWDESRFVVRGGEKIPAVITIDEAVAAARGGSA